MQEEFVAEMLLRLYLFCQSFLYRTGRSAAIPTGAARHRGCCPVSSGAQCLYNPFFSGSEAKIPFFFSPLFLTRDSWRRWRGGSWQLAGDAHVSLWPLPPSPAPCPPASWHSVYCIPHIPHPRHLWVPFFLNQPSCALAEVGARLGIPWDPTRHRVEMEQGK